MNKYIEIALKEAEKSIKTGDIPVGAIIVEKDKIIAKIKIIKRKILIVIE